MGSLSHHGYLPQYHIKRPEFIMYKLSAPPHLSACHRVTLPSWLSSTVLHQETWNSPCTNCQHHLICQHVAELLINHGYLPQYYAKRPGIHHVQTVSTISFVSMSQSCSSIMAISHSTTPRDLEFIRYKLKAPPRSSTSHRVAHQSWLPPTELCRKTWNSSCTNCQHRLVC